MMGKCNCGSVAFEISGNIPAVYHCYCTLCQKQGGAACSAGTIVEFDRFRWVTDPSCIRKWQKESGFSSHFCSVCGSPAPNIFRSKYVWIPAGLIADMDSQAVANIWLMSKPAWANPVELEWNLDSGPDNLEEFVLFLNSGKQANSG